MTISKKNGISSIVWKSSTRQLIIWCRLKTEHYNRNICSIKQQKVWLSATPYKELPLYKRLRFKLLTNWKLVRFWRVFPLSYILHRSAGRAPFPLSLILANVLTRRIIYCFRLDIGLLPYNYCLRALYGANIKWSSFTGWITRLPNPVYYPPLRASESIDHRIMS